jgi:hypothetical protein
MSSRHINLRKIAERIYACQAAWPSLAFQTQPTDPEDIRTILMRERLEMSDWNFRQRYARWL